MSKDKSIYWINNLKAIGILLVIIGHNDTRLTKYIYSFHMPLFFFLSGILFNDKKWTNTMDYIKAKAKGILVPYFLLSFTLYIIWIPIDLIQGKVINLQILFKNFIGIFYSQGVHEYMTWGVPMWFLTCLFVVTIMFFVINKKYKEHLVPILLGFSVIGYLFNYSDIRLPWSIDVALVAIVFYGIGFLLRKKLMDYKPSKKGNFIGVILLCISLVSCKLNGRIDMYSSIYHNYFLFYIGAFSSIIYMIIFIKGMKENKILTFIGINTIYILAFHIRVKEVIKLMFRLFSLEVNFESLFAGGIVLPIYQLLILVPIILIINNKIKSIRVRLLR